MTDEVVSRSEFLGNPNGVDTPSHEILLCPLTSGFPANLVDLEPFSFTLVELVASNATTRSHISQHRTSVVRPLIVDRSAKNKETTVNSTYIAIRSSLPSESDGIAWFCVREESSFSGIVTASERKVLGTIIRILSVD